MRLIHYHIINKNTKQKIYTNCKFSKCKRILDAMKQEDKQNYKITYKWLSI